jgi:hypothetical protein
MHDKHALLILIAVLILIGDGCVNTKQPPGTDRSTEGEEADASGLEAGTRPQRIKPPEATAPGTPEYHLDAQVIEPHNESPIRATSLFTDAEIPPVQVQSDDAGDRGSVTMIADAARAPSQEGTLSRDASAQRADSAEPRIPAPNAPGQLVITEVMANPKTVTDSQGEWFELYNPSESAMYNLRGCEIADDGATKCTVGTDLIAAPRAYITIARNASPGFVPSYVCSGLSLTNADPDQVIVRCGAVVIDRITYEKAKEAVSLALDDIKLDARANDDPASWCAPIASYNGEDLGTPGAPNAACPLSGEE